MKKLIIQGLKKTSSSISLGLKQTMCHPKAVAKRGIHFCLKTWERFVISVVLLLFILYPTLAFFESKIDDAPDFADIAVEEGQLKVLNTAAALIDREVNQYGWKANLPIFFPSGWLDNMPSFQMGIVEGLSNFVGFYSDERMQKAADLLSVSGRTWYVNLSSHLEPRTPAQRSYRQALSLIEDYNQNLNNQLLTTAQFSAILSALTDDLSRSVMKISARIEEAVDKYIDLTADNVFYKAKGKAYTAYLLLRDLREDYNYLIHTPEEEIAYNDALDALQKAFTYTPWFILNGNSEGFIVPSHLSTQGLYMMQAIDAIKTVQELMEKING